MNKQQEIEKLEILFTETLRLISIYCKNNWSIPSSLKGNLGEFLFAKESLKRFPNSNIKYRGGSFPGIDIMIDSLRIQVKTQVKHKPITFRGGYLEFESSPTIKRKTIEDGKCDILILFILHPSEDFSKILNSYFYTFNKNDFSKFSTILCWSGKSKGDYTIVNILNIVGKPTSKIQTVLEKYNNEEYKNLFDSSLNNWEKVKTIPKLSVAGHYAI